MSKQRTDQLQLEDEDIPITLRRAWDRALRLLAQQVNKPTFETHIRTLRPLALAEEPDNGRPGLRITLGVPSAFTREWVEKRHAPLIANLLEEVLDRDNIRLRFVLSPRGSDGKSESASTGVGPVPPPVPPTPHLSAEELQLVPPTPPAPLSPAAESSPASLPAAPTTPATHPGAKSPKPASKPATVHDAPTLNARYTFENFVIGPSNRLAHAGAISVAQSPGQSYNPLFLYGPPGMGKTHLMHAIGNAVQKDGGGRIAYVSGEAFTSYYIASLRDRRADEFRRKWRSVDVWLVDDIQFIAGKEHTKEEFFHTFNALHQDGKQIVISSDRSPRELRAMDERLRSRFECGLIADIAPPDLETRLAILQKKAQVERMRIPDDVLLYMARLVQSNIRTLEGALVKLIAYASLVNSPVTTQLASDVLERYYITSGAGSAPASGGGDSEADSGAPESSPASVFPARGIGEPRPISGEHVQRVVARRFGIDPDALMGKKRDKATAQARQIAMHLMRELTAMSLPGIGQLFDRDHSTVMYACDRVRDQMLADDELRRLVADVISELRPLSH